MTEKTVLITGANRGIGLALVHEYVANDWHVLATCYGPDGATGLQDFAKQEKRVEVLQLDVTDQNSIDALAAHLKGRPLDLLINNAGIFSGSDTSLQSIDTDPAQTLGTIDPLALEELFRVNTIGPIMVTQALLPNLRMGSTRKIANISSRWGSIAAMEVDTPLGYGTSKAALNAATRSMALTLQRERFVVVSLNPGWVRTDMGGQNAGMLPQESARRLHIVIEALVPEQTGQFLRHTGENIAW